jgi:peptidoglycan/xylan/chitin deacetylase (PgdA/CDA1 family)
LTPELLALLREYRFPATFFLIGQEAEKYPWLLEEIAKHGHSIGSHSYRHAPWANFYLTAQWRKELMATELALGKYLTNTWFRPPFALMSPHLACALQEKGYSVVLFHIRAIDFGNRRVAHLAQRLFKHIGRGGVVMFHGALPKEATDFHKKQVLQEIRFFLETLAQRKDLEVISLQKY